METGRGSFQEEISELARKIVFLWGSSCSNKFYDYESSNVHVIFLWNTQRGSQKIRFLSIMFFSSKVTSIRRNIDSPIGILFVIWKTKVA
jgi:hypothetical protein